jgi:hypothetical protein
VLHIAPIRRCFTAFAIVAAAAAMTGCEGGMTMTDAATRDTRAELRRSPRAIASGHDRAEQAAAQDREDRAGAGEAASDERAGAEKSKSKDAAKSEAAAAVAAREDREDRDGADHLTLDIGDAVPELYAIVRTPGIDLEFTEGLREPPQSEIMPGPAPWTPIRRRPTRPRRSSRTCGP